MTMARGDGTTFEKQVLEASERLSGIAERTPLQPNIRLSAATGTEVWFKREDLQVGRSYKLRGAYNLISQLDDEARAAGVVCASAGNHAQGFAFACAAHRVHGRVVIPSTTPRQKRERIVALGGEMIDLVVEGDTYDESSAAATRWSDETGATLVPAFDDSRTVAGQATVVAEIVEQLGRAPDTIVVPVGGGGLLAGTATWLQATHPRTRVVGVEPAGARNVAAALHAGSPVVLDEHGFDRFVDGAAVRKAGAVTYPLIRRSGAELVAVDEGLVCTEMLSLYQTDGIIAEPAGALAGAAIRPDGPGLDLVPGETVVVVLSGGNNDVSRYAEVIERSLRFQGLKHYFLVEFPQEPGALRRFLDEVLGPDDDVTRFEYVKKDNRESGPALVGVEIGSRDDLEPLLERMARSPLQIEALEPGSPAFRFLL
jgi:threonine dehydratase